MVSCRRHGASHHTEINIGYSPSQVLAYAHSRSRKQPAEAKDICCCSVTCAGSNYLSPCFYTSERSSWSSGHWRCCWCLPDHVLELLLPATTPTNLLLPATYTTCCCQ